MDRHQVTLIIWGHHCTILFVLSTFEHIAAAAVVVVVVLKHHTQIDKYNNSGIYQMKCLDCLLKYIGQTGRKFNLRYK
jgi:formate/nitrite transporter FocA (FNT family)